MPSTIIDKYTPYDLVRDENGCVLTGIEAYPPFTTYDGKNFGGTCLELYEMIMAKLDLCFKLIKSPNGLFGAKFPNGTWTGLVGLAQHEIVEALVCPISTVYSRFLAIDFSEAAISSSYSIVYARPVVQPNFMGFVMPFSYQTWLLLFFTMLFATGLSVFLNKTFFVRLNKRIRKKNPDGPLANLPNELWFKGIIAQPITKSPEEVGSRFLMAIWLLMMAVMGVTFRCNLKALLIVPKIEIPFNNLEELLNQDDYGWSFLKGSIVGQYFHPAYEEDPNSLMGRGWVGRGELYTNGADIPDFVLDHRLACIAITARVTALFSEDFSETGKCRLATARDNLIKIEMTFGLKKKSKFANLINPIIMNLREFGILGKIFSKDTVNSTYCNVPPGSEIGFKERPLTVVDFLGTFTILGAGYTAATIAFLLEIASKRLENKRSGQQNLA